MVSQVSGINNNINFQASTVGSSATSVPSSSIFGETVSAGAGQIAFVPISAINFAIENKKAGKKLADTMGTIKQGLSDANVGKTKSFFQNFKNASSEYETGRGVVNNLRNQSKETIRRAKAAKKGTIATGGATETVAKKSFFSKAVSKIGEKTGLTKLVKAAVNKFPVLGKVGKLFKGSCAGMMAAIEGVMETFSEVIPAFKNGGAKEGFKQIGKSALKVASSTIGWVLGEKAGTAIGFAIGNLICPGLGGMIGGFIGKIAGGAAVSALASGITKKITGKSFSEKQAEQAVLANQTSFGSLTANTATGNLESQINQSVRTNATTNTTGNTLQYNYNTGNFAEIMSGYEADTLNLDTVA